MTTGEWTRRYGAGIAISASSDVLVQGCRARRRQNGLILDRVTLSRILDNDFSFLSGWGIALWRSSHNTICRNRVDFCIRGYSHGVYNRGQDSAGLLLFEQCNRNVIAHNSATHGGDGLFGFGGEETLGTAAAMPDGFDHQRKGNNDNIIAFNDFSHAAAHGLEMTFSFGNRIFENRFTGNAICGIWAGYSQDTVIMANRFEGNGDAGYGLERGGVNIEHGARERDPRQRVRGRRVRRASLDRRGRGASRHAVGAGQLSGLGRQHHHRQPRARRTVGIHLRDTGLTAVLDNRMHDVERSFEVTPGADPVLLLTPPDAPELPAVACPGVERDPTSGTRPAADEKRS